jgi:Ca2+-binding RTX toxin-like protein
MTDRVSKVVGRRVRGLVTAIAVTLATTTALVPAAAAGKRCANLPATISGSGVIAATSADDVINGSRVADTVDALAGNDTICGLAGPDLLAGGSGNDRLLGGRGNDVLEGGLGTDTLSLGPGADTISLRDPNASDTVTDYLSGDDGLAVDMSLFEIGNGDTVIDSPVATSGPWSTASELVISTRTFTSLTPLGVGAEFSTAASPVPSGSVRLLAASDGTASALFSFTSDGDADVEASELVQVLLLAGTANLAVADFQFVE